MPTTYQAKDVTSVLVTQLLQSSASQPSIQIDAPSLMTAGAGRYVRATDSAAIGDVLTRFSGAFDQTVSYQDLVTTYGYTGGFSIKFSQYNTDIRSTDYGQKALV